MALNIPQGGKCNGLTKPQEALLNQLRLCLPNEEFVAELVLITGKKPGSPYPRHYSIDIAMPKHKLAIEVDGPSHIGPKARTIDRRKERWLRQNKWSVIRVKNESINRNVHNSAIRVVLHWQRLTENFPYIK